MWRYVVNLEVCKYSLSRIVSTVPPRNSFPIFHPSLPFHSKNISPARTKNANIFVSRCTMSTSSKDYQNPKGPDQHEGTPKEHEHPKSSPKTKEDDLKKRRDFQDFKDQSAFVQGKTALNLDEFDPFYKYTKPILGELFGLQTTYIRKPPPKNWKKFREMTLREMVTLEHAVIFSVYWGAGLLAILLLGWVGYQLFSVDSGNPTYFFSWRKIKRDKRE